MVIAYCPGTLSCLLKQNGSVPFEAMGNFVRQLSAASKYLYNNRILHRDIKPENVLTFSAEGWTNNLPFQLCDFGLV